MDWRKSRDPNFVLRNTWTDIFSSFWSICSPFGPFLAPLEATKHGHNMTLFIIVGKTSRRHQCYFPGFLCYFFCHSTITRNYCFFAFCCENLHRCWMSRHPVLLKGSTSMPFNGISRYLEANFWLSFCAISLCELSVCAIFTHFPTLLFIGVFFLVHSLTDVV